MDKKIDFLERRLLSLLTVGLSLILIVNFLLGIYYPEISLIGLNEFLATKVKDTLIAKEGVLTTIAAVFTGIYFTIFTLFGSLKLESTFAAISQANFFKLVKFLYHAFAGSFAYLFWTIFVSFFLEPQKSHMNTLLVITLIIFLFYMMMSAFRFGVYCYLIYKNDLKNLHIQIEQEKLKNFERDALYERLKLFLDDFDYRQSIERAEQMKEHLANRNKD
ncbi:hypothetical protein MKY82_08430 [Paenibacillus sp. FSL W7-1279]|uniref:hypothetical protein n=1 Tax=Paenibacillus sp. FSL W7-1279 TaxID=2921697 RepID=UPI0030D9C520